MVDRNEKKGNGIMKWDMKKTYRVSAVIAAATLLLTGKVMAGGGYPINWDNDGSQFSGLQNAFYSNQGGTTFLPAGDLVQLIAIAGGTNYVLATTTLGQNPAALTSAGVGTNGFFDVSNIVASNLLASVVGDPLGVAFYAGTTTAAAKLTVYSPDVLSPSPNWATPPLAAIVVEPDNGAPGNGDYADAWVTVLGNGATSGGVTGNSAGYYVVAVPEPSTYVLVGTGLLGLLGLRRRRS